MLRVNEQPYPFHDGMRLGELADLIKPDADILVLNGAPASRDSLLQDKDVCSLIKTGEIPSALDMRCTLEARHGRDVQQLFQKACVGIMGLGGLGSVVALSLAKIGIGKLILADHDVVVLSNIHRQQYFINQIGMKKTVALKETLVRVNPFIAVTTYDVKITENTLPNLFAGVDVLVECFDDAAMKAAAMRAAMQHLPEIGYIGASGVAGYGDGNSITCKKIKTGVYIAGDGKSIDVNSSGLFAPRVGIVAHHQANQVVRLILGLDEE